MLITAETQPTSSSALRPQQPPTYKKCPAYQEMTIAEDGAQPVSRHVYIADVHSTVSVVISSLPI